MLIDLIRSVETKKVKNNFQDKLRRDAEKVRSENKLYISADKTTNFYKLDKNTYNDLLKKNVTSDYKKTDMHTVDKSNQKQKEMVIKLDLEDRVFATAQKDAYITVKDHKDTTTPSAD